jgi:NAD(P)-dependent dehydrogenase (short-subunit alcohol dehydrogenase family)
MTLDGKAAVVTGAGRGVGRGIALALAKAGADVAVLELDPATGKATADEITALGRRAIVQECDVRNAADCEAGIAAAVDAFGGVDILVNNAQQLRVGVPLIDCTDDDMLLAWESGTLATFRLMRLCHPIMKARGGGAIVNLGSGAGTEGVIGLGPYGSAKEGIRGLTKVAALEWGVDGIRVNTVCPWANSAYWDDMPEAQRAAQLKHNPLRRIGDCEDDVGAVVAFLASDAASYVTAQTIMVDGGNMGFR